MKKLSLEQFLILAWLLSVLVFVVSASLHAASWEGIYRVEGKNPNGTIYTSALEVVKIPDTGFYSLRWQMDADPEGERQMLAIAYEHGDFLIATGYNFSMFGSFKQKGESRWVSPGFDRPMTEKWSRSKELTLEKALKPGPTPTGHPPLEVPKPQRQASL